MAAGIVLAVFTALSGIAIPFILAVVGATLLLPLVDSLKKRGLPRALGAVIAMTVIVIVVVVLTVMVVRGIVDQGPKIDTAIAAGVQAIGNWLADNGIDPSAADTTERAARDLLPSLGQGIAGAIGSVFSSAMAFFVGTFFGFFILFFMLKDGPAISGWFARHISVDSEMGGEILADAGGAIRGYYRGTAVTASATAIVVVIPVILLDVPLVVPIFLVYFFTSFIPYLGAWIAGAFAVLIALGTGGIETAAIIAVAVLVSNGIVQSAVSSWAVGGELDMHPLVIFLVTIAAGTVGGVTLMILAAPLAAIVLHTTERLKEAGVFNEG